MKCMRRESKLKNAKLVHDRTRVLIGDQFINLFTANLDFVTQTFWFCWVCFFVFLHIELSNCDVTRASLEFESHHGFSLDENCMKPLHRDLFNLAKSSQS